MDPAAYRTSANMGNNSQNYGDTSSSNTHFDCDERGQILEWLSPLAPGGRHPVISVDRVDGVGDWCLCTKELMEWHKNEDQTVNRVLFLPGEPGVGKTYLCSLVIDTLCDQIEEEAVVAYVYCDYRAYEEQSATSVLGSVIRQVVGRLGHVPEEIKNAFERARKQVSHRRPRLPELCEMLVKTLLSLKRSFICVDALDEFPSEHRPELWESLQHILRECPNARLFLTARPEIVNEVEIYFTEAVDMVYVDPPNDDIRLYLRAKLEIDLHPEAMNEDLRADILRLVLGPIRKILLLVSLIVDAILGRATIPERREALRKMTGGIGLQDAYRTTVNCLRAQSEVKAKLGMQVLMWISCSERPLKAEELCSALAVEVGNIDLQMENVPSIGAVLGCTLGLVTMDEQASTVSLRHFTLQEYLGAHTSLFTTPHSMIAEICLTYLNFQFVSDLPTTLNVTTPMTPLLRYASCYWGSHAKREPSERAKSLALQVLTQYPEHVSANILLADMILRPVRGFTGLHCIAYLGIAEIAAAMVRMKRWDLNGRDSIDATPLMWACRYKNYSVTKLLLAEEDVDPNLPDHDGLTLLSRASRSGDEPLVKLLLERENVSPDSPDKNGRTPLLWAARSGHEGIVRLFLEREDLNPDAPDNSGQTPLSSAAEEGHEGVVRLLLEREDVSPDSLNNNGRTPLSFAAWSGNKGAVRLLLGQESVNPDSSDNYGQTPLLWAARSGHEDIVSLLLGRVEVNPDTSDIYNQTPLLWAARSGHEGIVNLLLGREGLDPDPSNTNGRTPLFFAASSGHEGIVNLLLQQEDVNPDSPDNKGRTPLSRAAMKGHEGVVKQLLGRADVSIDWPDKDGRTPLSLAAMRGNEGVLKLLSQLKRPTPGLSRSSKQIEQPSVPAVGGPGAAVSSRVPPREADICLGITDKITDAASPPRPDEPPPNPPDESPPASIFTPTPAFWVSCGVLLLSVIVIARFQARRKYNLLG